MWQRFVCTYEVCAVRATLCFVCCVQSDSETLGDSTEQKVSIWLRENAKSKWVKMKKTKLY